MAKRIELGGRRFGKLTVIGLARPKGYTTYWLCRCECGAEKSVRGAHLRGGLIISCGCVGSRRRFDASRKHGESHSTTGPRSREYTTWKAIKQRCYNPNNPRYGDYGGRGITVCAKWRWSFSAFLDDVGRAPSKKHTLDRIDNGKGYEPGNVRWATQKEQNRNKRSNHRVVIEGENLSLADAADRIGVPYARVITRVMRGWSPMDALTKPVGNNAGRWNNHKSQDRRGRPVLNGSSNGGRSPGD